MRNISIDEQRRLLDQLSQLVLERVRAEASARASFGARETTLREQFGSQQQRVTSRQRVEREERQSQYTNALSRIAREYELAVEEALTIQERSHRETTLAAEKAVEQAGAEWEETRVKLNGDFDAEVRELVRILQEFKEKVDQQRGELRAVETDARRVLKRRYCLRKASRVRVPADKCDMSDPVGSFAKSLGSARQAVRSLAGQKLPKFLLTMVVLMIPVLVVTLGMLVAGLLIDPAGGSGDAQAAVAPDSGADARLPVLTGRADAANRQYLTFAMGGAAVLGVMAVVYAVVRPMVVARTKDGFTAVQRHLASGDAALDVAHKLRTAEADAKKISLKQLLVERLRQLDRSHQERLEAISSHREGQLREATEVQQRKRRLANESRETQQKAVNEQFSQQSQQLGTQHAEQSLDIQQRAERETAASREMFERAWNRLVLHWKSGMADVTAGLDEMETYCRRRFPDWNETDWSNWTTPDESLLAVRFGSYAFRLDMLDRGVPEHEDLRLDRVEFSIPAVMQFSDRSALLWEAWDQGRSVASRAMQNVMLRLLTSLPPGKVRLTIIDPVGLGQNFSAFMHLADFDEKLVTHRIWTEPAHINQRLSDLTEHMEDVIQTYLRNEFQTIEEYNRQAGEVAEPIQVLVVANFPAGFSDESAQRLLSIITSGVRCGVYTLVSTDAKLEWPRNFDITDLEALSVTLQWNGNRFCWREDVLKDLPLTLDEPPANERLTQIIRIIGSEAKDAIRVEVPFTTVSASPDQWWTHDSRGGIDVALGRAGASKLQYLRLGHGTSQHVLISGKTGSGKSTLLHALITNAAIHYSPDELEFYLIDFKKGVEFKAYATNCLPHARVVAIESEREFGMSVLERLDHELRVRGDLFRRYGVQDIRNFRDANPGLRMPRVLLIIDEFQEFFTQDDRLAQDAALFLDRLVRQGRAFGIHVLLGSQTLAGAYTLARSTLGQMAVRIALQCSETDSHLILSEDNTAARLLSRPGEAIYNDANGLFEGNHPFQVVWLGAGEQEAYLAKLAARAREQNLDSLSQIVFEGNAPADPAENVPLRQLLAVAEPTDAHLAPRAWLGAAIAIKDPTFASFRRQSGANLLMAGQQEDMALGMLAVSIISLGTAFPEGNGSRARFVILDGTRPEAPESGWWRRFAEQFPWSIEIATAADAGARTSELASEVARRAVSGREGDAPIFLVVYNLARLRELRRSEDDFGFSSLDSDKTASVSQQFAAILRDGPAVGVHVLVWCDTLNTLNRWLDRTTLREFDQRVLMQMSANDSSNLMDSPAASRLGQHRALLYSEELGTHEKFRPYGIPSPEWLNWFNQQLAARTTDATL